MTYDAGIVLKPIGYVKTSAQGDEIKDRQHLSEVIINPELAEALEGVEAFSHVYVLFWLNKITAEQRSILKVHPRGRKDLPLLGVFATRTYLRPNPIGLTLVELLKVDGNVLTVRGLDAYDGTPVLDVKPFDAWDTTTEPRVPKWWMQLERERQAART